MTSKTPKEEIGALLDDGKYTIDTVIQTLANAHINNNSSAGFFKQNDIEKKKNNSEIKDQAEKTDKTIREMSKELGVAFTVTNTNSASLGLGSSSNNNNE